ncbi:nickel pincer cofactor biosynthesis protein LarB [Halarchaeum nitratireducens]|uniref:Phosphoribosylaminoimidazole carboxylase n=1 Tax=Halarchaeum nitratireducens TaxID=489913 RepID=A0A830G8E0_9EURY|nr:nickel pincer cofactor biosynthesis protein LarB [Halarchaeum nitratireducens]GGN11556.1 phosphoribosylaminoimidazole carboxylase [Halarchaeum nitratireducens]
MRDVLEQLAAGELSVAEAEAELAGYATTDAGRFDAARETRRGVPEAVLAEGKTPAEVGALAATAMETAGRALVTRADDERRAAVRAAMAEEHPDADVTVDERARVVVAHAPAFEPPALDATVGLVSGGTSDAAALGEADAVATEMGARTMRVEDVGVASIARLLDRVDELRACDVVVVAAGREGALPTVVAGLLDAPVIGLPVSTGYGHGGRGEAAMLGMLQSCTVLSAVNVDAGFVAGAQAGLIARRIAAARAE